MVVLSNSTPLIYLAKMGELNLLRRLFGEVIVAEKVFEEVVVQGAGKSGSEEVKGADWIKRMAVSDQVAVQKLREEEFLDAGEAETLILALEMKADLVLLDERRARKAAAKAKVKRAGTIALILMAYQQGLVEDLPTVLKKAREKAFQINEKVFDRLKKRGVLKHRKKPYRSR
jgi:predicted nucleic acid-binding protein